jgi:hypothetical protein
MGTIRILARGCRRALLILLSACNPRPEAIAPDFEIDFSCKVPPSEAAVEAFSRRNGFVAFNEERARRRRERAFFPLQIDSYNSHRWVLDFIGLEEPPSRGQRVHYRLTIFSPPPTIHDARLENAALDFVRTTMHCKVDLLAAHDNGKESAAMFERIFAEEQRRIAGWHKCHGPLDTACAR